MNPRLLVLLLVPLILSGCNLFGCAYERRSVRAGGNIIENADTLADAQMMVGAAKGSIENKDLSATISGSLKGHVTSITLASSVDPAFQLSIPLSDPSLPTIANVNFLQRKGETTPSLGGVFEIIASNEGVLDIRTDLPSRPQVSMPLTASDKRNWYRPQNCY